MSTETNIPTFDKLGYPAVNALESWVGDNVDLGSDHFFRENDDGSLVQSPEVLNELYLLQRNYARMLDFIETVAEGNTEIQALENEARNILDCLSRPGA